MIHAFVITALALLVPTATVSAEPFSVKADLETYQEELLILVIARLQITGIDYDTLHNDTKSEIDDVVLSGAVELALKDDVFADELTGKADELMGKMPFALPTVSHKTTIETKLTTPAIGQYNDSNPTQANFSLAQFQSYRDTIKSVIMTLLANVSLTLDTLSPEAKATIDSLVNSSAMALAVRSNVSAADIDQQINSIVEKLSSDPNASTSSSHKPTMTNQQTNVTTLIDGATTIIVSTSTTVSTSTSSAVSSPSTTSKTKSGSTQLHEGITSSTKVLFCALTIVTWQCFVHADG